MADFDPYYKWLGIHKEEQPPNHYRLLAIDMFESDPDVIDAAASKQVAYLQGCATGPHVALSQKLLNEIAAARLCLLHPPKKDEYDRRLRNLLAPPEPVAPPLHVPLATSAQDNVGLHTLDAPLSKPMPRSIGARTARSSKQSSDQRIWIGLGVIAVCVVAAVAIIAANAGGGAKAARTTRNEVTSRPTEARAGKSVKHDEAFASRLQSQQRPESQGETKAEPQPKATSSPLVDLDEAPHEALNETSTSPPRPSDDSPKLPMRVSPAIPEIPGVRIPPVPDMTIPQPPVIPGPQPRPAKTEAKELSNKLRIVAKVDGKDRLVLTKTQLRWMHDSFQWPPEVEVDGMKWNPKASPILTFNSAVSKRMAKRDFTTATLRKVQGRGTAQIRASTEQITVTFNDSGPGGADVYEVEVIFK